MIAMVRHRGPDAAGTIVDRGTGLAHARLSIIDLQHGSQPMQNGDGSLVITFNGEIFNFVELRDELTTRGHRFRTESDTEVILHAYEEYGEECVRHFNGQWAFAIWDRCERKLFLSRDRLGIRPLFFARAGSKFLFASEVKSLFVFPELSRELDPRGLSQLFTFWAPLAPATVFRSVSELPPGHNLTVRDGEQRVYRYWQLDFCEDTHGVSSQQWTDELRDLLMDATRLRMRADVPVGAYLSGGLDSSVTAAMARRMSPDRLRTFSITFADDEFDESPYQRSLVDYLGVEHLAMHCSYADIAGAFPDVVWHAEKPMLRTAPAPLFLLSQKVHQAGFKVVLTGEGADEVLGGYDIFKEAKVRRFCARQPESEERAKLFDRLYPYLPNLQSQSSAWRIAFFRAHPEDLDDPFFSHRPRWDVTAQVQRFFAPTFFESVHRQQVWDDLRDRLPAEYERWDPFSQAQYLETAFLLPGYILSSQGDRVALAHSVEGRFPFLDHRLAEFAARVPPRLKMRGLNEKYLLKRATKNLVPPEVTRRAKQPYRAPDARSFFHADKDTAREEYVDELLSGERLREDGVFSADAVQRLVQKVRKAGAAGTKDNMALVGILSTQILVDRFVRNFPVRAETHTPNVVVDLSASVPQPV